LRNEFTDCKLSRGMGIGMLYSKGNKSHYMLYFVQFMAQAHWHFAILIHESSVQLSKTKRDFDSQVLSDHQLFAISFYSKVIAFLWRYNIILYGSKIQNNRLKIINNNIKCMYTFKRTLHDKF
jgi:hypothetical protein